MKEEGKSNGVGLAMTKMSAEWPCQDFYDVLCWEKDEYLFLSYLTKWSSNENDVITIADIYNVSFVHDAFEPDNNIYQRCKYLVGESLVYAKMQQFDFEMIDFNRDSYFPD